ncbi:MAG: ribonuclease HIII [Parachlamydiaceae bacterium]|nr:ribonuclease HIII [Parachlamydiaceae bacterium]
MSDTQPNTFVANVDLKLKDKLLKDLKDQGFEFTTPPYTIFSAQKKGVTCIFYQSGKMVVQGKDRAAFIEFYLEPEILGTFKFTNPLIGVDLSPHIGIDESGKGDFFGPLCVAGVYASEKDIGELQSIGVRDSKLITDINIHKIADKIKNKFLYHIVKINPSKYNEIYANFKNLNRLLGWGHATTIEQLIEKSNCRKVVIDQFADESVVITALKRKKIDVDLTQRHRAEEDLVVAAASILARHAFLDGLDQLGKDIGIVLPKGASAATIAAGKKIFSKYGIDGLLRVCKQHFKTLDQILGKERQ